MHRATADLRKSEIPGFQPRETAPGPHQRVPRAGRGGAETVASAGGFRCGAHTLLMSTLHEARKSHNPFLIRHRVTVSARIRSGDPIPAGRIDEYGCRTTLNAERPDLVHIVTAGLQVLEYGIRDLGFNIQLVEAGRVRPERAEEVQRLHPRPLERRVQIRIPVGPEFHDVEECLQDGLVLIVPSRRADRHERFAVPEDDAWRQRVARPGPRPQLCGACLVEPELLAPHAHTDSRLTKDDRASDPAAAL